MMRKTFQEEIEELNIRFYKMGQLVNEAVHQAIQAFSEQDVQLAEKVIANDLEINKMEEILEKESIEMIALQQPVSSDLRKIITVMKACADLERMGDHAVSISKATLHMAGVDSDPEITTRIIEITRMVKQMLQDVLDAFVKTDEHKARETAFNDGHVDRLTNELHVEIIESMKTNPNKIEAAVNEMMIATYLERIGDYITNISEWIVYLSTGELLELHPHYSERK